jgi:large subunit ribosomal protein L7A
VTQADVEALEHLRSAEHRTVGTNQTAKAIRRGRAQLVFVAADADRRVLEEVLAAVRDAGLIVIEVPSMRDLGRACGIAVGAAAAALLTPPPADG